MTSAFSRAADLLDPPKRNTWALIGYEPACVPRVIAQREGKPVPPACGRCPQELAAAAKEDDVLYGGAAGGGKTTWLVADAIRAVDQHPGLRAGLFRRTYDELKEGPLTELAKFGYGVALGCRWNSTEHELVFPSGGLIRFRYLENLVDATRRQGGEYQWLGFDERTLFAPGVVDVVAERLRTWDGGPPVIGIRSTSNPGNASHGEVKRRYIEATDHGERVARDGQGHTIRFIPAKVDDNPFVDPGYRGRLLAIPDPQRRKAMLEGSWDVFAGQVFTEWSHDRHVVQPWLLPASWPRFAAVDWGWAAPWAVVWGAKDEDGRIWVYREMYDTEVGEGEQARRILAAERHGQAQGLGDDGATVAVPEPPAYRVGDPAMAAKRGDAESILTAYEKAGCSVEPANNDRISGWQRVHEYLADAPACPHHRAQGLDQCPRLHVFAGCANLIRTLPALVYDVRRVEDVDTRGEDHAPDALRYLLMAAGEGRPRFIHPSDEARSAVTAAPEQRIAAALGDFAVVPKGDAIAPWVSGGGFFGSD